ncbi:MAG: serine O-acetyltransferase [Hyphomicrobiaceae bacterium]|jgi:serine O-acetyltransferase
MLDTKQSGDAAVADSLMAAELVSLRRHALQDGSRNQNPSGMTFWRLAREDFEANGRSMLSQGFWALFWHRFGNWRMSLRPKVLRAPFSVLYRIMHKACQWFCGIDLPYNVVVGRRVRLEHFGGMVLVAASIGDDVYIRQNTTFGIKRPNATDGWPVIGNRVDIGVGAVVLGAVEIGDDAVIGANCVVPKSVLAGSVVGGVPARLIRMRDDI